MGRARSFPVAFGVTALLLAAASWLPWFRRTVATSWGETGVLSAGAWGSSTVWSAAVVLGVVAGVAAVVVGHRTGGAVVALVLASVGLALWFTEVVRVQQSSPEPGTAGGSISLTVSESNATDREPFEGYGVERDELSLITLDGYTSEFAGGVWTGGLLLGVLVLLAAVATRSARRGEGSR
ncbi:hypothetical protein [Blastococcus sp. LR1]|uniref:hypothetical protein n=1 Tax=Blastococcus sp. LR1 TaxID=2877000 RepID=UPI001CCA6BA1|nr:hypothetical protein [Blastococcus sp. LR1]MCA0143492.1 hypothetical protein [Blastococcus sp. LR1]